jgi:hypothetical protein
MGSKKKGMYTESWAKNIKTGRVGWLWLAQKDVYTFESDGLARDVANRLPNGRTESRRLLDAGEIVGSVEERVDAAGRAG